MAFSILLYDSSLKRALNPLERTDSLRCSVELRGGEKVSLIALRRSSSSRVGLCRVENMAPSHFLLTLVFFFTCSTFVTVTGILVHLFKCCHCHCQFTESCQNKLPLIAPISFTPFGNGENTGE